MRSAQAALDVIFSETSADDRGAQEDSFLLAIQGDGRALVPNWTVNSETFLAMRGMQGEDVKKYVQVTENRLKLMSQAGDPEALALQMLAGGILSITVPMVVGVAKEVIAGTALRAAVVAGIKSIGFKTAIGAVVIAAFTLLSWLVTSNPKEIMGLVANNTSMDLTIGGDTYMNCGEMTSMMDNFPDPVQLTKRLSVSSEGTVTTFVSVGVYSAQKKFGLFGAEGIMRFTDPTSGFAFDQMFAVPYSKDNGINVREARGEGLPDSFTQLYASRDVRVSTRVGIPFT